LPTNEQIVKHYARAIMTKTGCGDKKIEIDVENYIIMCFHDVMHNPDA